MAPIRLLNIWLGLGLGFGGNRKLGLNFQKFTLALLFKGGHQKGVLGPRKGFPRNLWVSLRGGGFNGSLLYNTPGVKH